MTVMAAMSCGFTTVAAAGVRRGAAPRGAGRKVAPSAAAKEVFPEDEAPTASGKVRIPRVIPQRKEKGKVDEIFPEDEAPTASGKKRSPRTIPARSGGPAAGLSLGNAWYPGAVAPAYLDGSMPGDYGFDPLRLGADPEKRRFFQEAELMNARFAMLAVPGILFTNATGLDNWATAGQSAMEGKPYQLWQLILAEVVFFAFVEGKRWQGYKEGNTRPFDPAGMDSPAARQKEIKNGRLAMLAFAGFVAQAAAYPGTGPIDNLQAHINDVANANITQLPGGGIAFMALCGALSGWPFLVVAENLFKDPNADEGFSPFPWPTK